MKRLAAFGVVARFDTTGVEYNGLYGRRQISLADMRRYLVLVRREDSSIEAFPRATQREVQLTSSLVGMDETGLPVEEELVAVVDLEDRVV